MDDEQAFSTNNPTIVAAFKSASAQAQDAMNQAVDDAKALGKNKGLMVGTSAFDGMRIKGLSPDDPGDPPGGWRMVGGQLEPRRGKPGEVARQWLKDHQPPNVRGILAEQHGLPLFAIGSPDAMRTRWATPLIFEHDGTLWASYRGRIDGTCTWEPRKLSELYAAKEAADAAEETVGAGNG